MKLIEMTKVAIEMHCKTSSLFFNARVMSTFSYFDDDDKQWHRKERKGKVQKLFHDLFMYRLLTGRKSGVKEAFSAVSIGLIVIFSKTFSNLAENQVARKIINKGRWGLHLGFSECTSASVQHQQPGPYRITLLCCHGKSRG